MSLEYQKVKVKNCQIPFYSAALEFMVIWFILQSAISCGQKRLFFENDVISLC